MKITILCTDSNHPVVSHLRNFIQNLVAEGHSATLIFNLSELSCGDILFLVSCSQIITANERRKFKRVFVLHASDLPRGRGWSPSIWSILSGENLITISLLEAEDPPDTGPIWLKTTFELEGHELYDEINDKLFEAEIYLMTQLVQKINSIKPKPQGDSMGGYLRKRNPSDSRIDPQKTIAEQFNLLRISDPKRYPAFFEYLGATYLIKIEKLKNE